MAGLSFRFSLIITLSALIIYIFTFRGWQQVTYAPPAVDRGSLVKLHGLVIQSDRSLSYPISHQAPSNTLPDASSITVFVPSTVTETIVVTSSTPTTQLPPAYSQAHPDDKFCEHRFGLQYLDNFKSTVVEYCTPSSRSSVTCFHSQTAQDRVDSFCLGSGSDFDAETCRFILACDQRDILPHDVARKIPRLNKLHQYWYETGPGWLMENAISLRDGSAAVTAEEATENIILIKREGGTNLWHSLMEVFAASMTLDVLGLASHPETGRPMFDEAERARTRVVIIDDADDGPYYDLWSLLAPQPVRRLRDIGSIPAAANIILPIAGAANPMWQGDWDALSCSHSLLLEVFVSRVLALFGLTQHVRPRAGKVRVTFIDRRGSRKLVDQEAHFAALSALGLEMELRVLDFASMPLIEQIQAVRATDVLVGVHGAGLTHSIFMRHGSAVVEVMPHNLQHKGFRNIAHLSSHSYFRIHALNPNVDVDWHGPDVAVERERLLEVVGAAVKSMYNQDLHDIDVS